MDLIAKIIIYGDIHLSSRNYGSHRDYPRETLEYFTKITETVEKEGATHLIGLGDLTYGKFHSLEYRKEVEEQLEKQYKLTRGNRYELKGNHDSATYGMTEYEFYLEKGLIKQSENLTIGNVNISMIDYGKHKKVDIITPDKEMVNIVLAHDYYKFRDTQLPNYGNAIELESMEEWFGVDLIICGHIHNYEKFSGLMLKGEGNQQQNKRTGVVYLGCMSRPSYREGFMQKEGTLGCITITEDLTVNYEELKIPLWELNKSFNLEQRAEEQTKKENKIDVTDIVKKINSHERRVGNPEDIIMAMENVDLKYRKKAIELLKEGNN